MVVSEMIVSVFLNKKTQYKKQLSYLSVRECDYKYNYNHKSILLYFLDIQLYLYMFVCVVIEMVAVD